MSIPITQSLMKSLQNYINGNECGIRLEAQFVHGIQFKPSEAMEIGIYFEYFAFGTLPKSGIKPTAKFKKSKKKNAHVTAEQSELLIKYERAQIQAENLKKSLEFYGLEVIDKGKKIHTILDDGTIVEGTLDLTLKTTKRIPVTNRETGAIRYIEPGLFCFADTKSSGLLGDKGKFSDMGWHPDFLPEKEKLMIQPVHYLMIGQRYYKLEDIPWFFFVANQANEIEQMWCHITVDPDKLEEHEQTCKDARITFEKHIRKGFKAVPELMRCAKCDLYGKCKDRAEHPQIHDIYF